MKIYSLRDLPLHREIALTIGAFDGIHLGHKRLIQETIKIAQTLKVEPALLTFEPHPRKVLYPNLDLKLLTTLDEKIRFIKKEGITNLILLPFNKALAELSPELFVERYLIDLLNTKAVIVGYNFHFGRGRAGNTDLLKKLGEKFNFLVEVLPALVINNRPVSSTLIRELLLKGEVERANQLLGRPYSLSGKVIHGKGRGKLLGFPTANLDIPKDKLLPAQGVYAVWAIVEDKKYQGALNIGFNPTFEEKKLSIEVHLLNYTNSSSLYNQTIEVHLVKRVRSEKKFNTIEELKTQIAEDCSLIQRILA